MATKTFKVALSLDNPRIIQSGIDVRSFDKQSIKIEIELTKNSQTYQIPTGAQIKISLLKLARQEQKIILDVPFTSAEAIEWLVPDYLDGYQGEVRVGVYLIVGTENIDVGYFNISSKVSDIDKAAEEFTESVMQGWDQIEADLAEIRATITQVNTLASDFTADVATKQSDVTSKYNAFDTSVTQAGQTIDDILALQPQFQSVLDETTGKDVISAPEIILGRGAYPTLGERLDSEKAEVTAQLAQIETQKADKLYVDDNFSALDTEITVINATKANDSAVRKKDVKIELEDMSSTMLAAIEGGGGTSFDLLSVPQAGSVTYDKLDSQLKKFKDNIGEVFYDSSHFNLVGGWSNIGNPPNAVIWSNWRNTDFIPVKKGDEIKVSTTLTTFGYPYLMIYDMNKAYISALKTISSVTNGTLRTFYHTIETDGFVRTQHDEYPTAGIGLWINIGKPVFLTPKNLSESNVPKKIETREITEFVPGGYNIMGTEETNEINMARTPFMRFPAGTIIQIKCPSPYQYMPLTSDVPNLPNKTYVGWMASTQSATFTVTAEHPYLAFAIRDALNTTTTLNISNMLSVCKLSYTTSVSYAFDVLREKQEVLNEVKEVDDKHTKSSSYLNRATFRSPGASQGGVITIIDDDGHNSVYSNLYPFLKNLGIPFGVAIVPKYSETNASYMTWGNIEELSKDTDFVEIMNHTYNHLNLSTLTPKGIHEQVERAVKWFNLRGIAPQGLVLPNGGNNATVLRIVQQYHDSCYGFNNTSVPVTHDTINNYFIRRSSFGVETNRLAKHKALVDTAVSQNGWLVITTHVDLAGYWNATSYTELEELIAYAKSVGCKFMLPKDAFQVFGNLVENDAGFRINAKGKIIGAT